MTRQEIDELILRGEFPDSCPHPQLIETHISWVILCDQFTYKIKRPVRYSFLDFSTPEKRAFYCRREVELNRRFTNDVYLDVIPVVKHNGVLALGATAGTLLDHAVRMRKLDPSRRMDLLLQEDRVKPADFRNLATVIAEFHKREEPIKEIDIPAIHDRVAALSHERDYIGSVLGLQASARIERAIDASSHFLRRYKSLLATRRDEGFFRDCHGDLHSRNIFLLPKPVLFDCIEFNDDYRRIDVLNEVAFLCMDLDAFGKPDASDQFMHLYNALLPCMRNEQEKNLFIYYKSYRANVKAKVYALQAQGAADIGRRDTALHQVERYLELMNSYVSHLG